MTTTGYGPVPFQNESPNTPVSRLPQEQLYQTLLNHMQGAFGTESQIDMVMPVAAGQIIVAGRVVSIDPVLNAFVLGMTGTNLAYFAKPAGGYSGIPAAGNVYGDGILALPACASYKLATTEFVSGSYPPGTPLTVITSSTGASFYNEAGSSNPTGDLLALGNKGFAYQDLGKLAPGAYYEDTIVGVTGCGVLANYDKPGRSILEFFTYWLPANIGTWSSSGMGSDYIG